MTLKYTADQIRDRESSMIGRGQKLVRTKENPNVTEGNPWWGWADGSDCMAGQAYALGFRTSPRDATPWQISIAAFRAHFGWDEVPMSQAKAGMLVLEYWPAEGDPVTSTVPNHIEYIHTIDHTAGTITTDSANTGPRPGVSEPRGFYRKTRTITGNNFLRAVVIPALGAPDTSPYGATAPVPQARKNVKLVAAFLNQRIATGDVKATTSDKDGITGPRYWTLVQTWGRQNGVYGPGYLIDGIVGPRTRQVEAIILKRAKAAGK